MSKISLLTFHFSLNPGAMLQAYGLTKAINRLGHEVEVIDYRPLSVRKSWGGPMPRHPVRFLRTVLFRRKARDFIKRYLPLSRIYLSVEELRQDPPRPDCIVCGSDQVWNITLPVRGFDPAFFLEFLGDTGPRRVSYAASFGDGTELGSYRERIRGLLSRFYRISVRDVKSRDMVYDLTGMRADHVLDPCFLTNYDSITPRPIASTPYILAYCHVRTGLAMQVLEELQHRLNMAVVSIGIDFDGAKVIKPGPLQWLSLMKYADFVCTDSFHGTCFSIINRKQFVTLPIENGMVRLEDILNTAGLTDRLVTLKDELEEILQAPIDYDAVAKKIEKIRESSESFLLDVLKT